MKAVGTQGKGSVLAAARAVGTQGNGSVLAARLAFAHIHAAVLGSTARDDATAVCSDYMSSLWLRKR